MLAIAVVAPWVLWALVRTLGLDGGATAVQAMAFTPYAALTSPLPVLAALLLRRRIIAAVAGVAVIALVFAVVPRAVAGGGPEARGPRLTVMTANLYVGRGDARTVVDLVRRYDVDVLCLVELTPAELARLDAAGIASALPHRVAEPLPGASGAAVLSRAPLTALESPHAGVNPQPAARLNPAGAPPVAITAVHPAPPVNGAREDGWTRALDALPSAETSQLRILAGDFNATLDHRALRGVLDRGYADAADRAGAGLRPTWPAVRRRALPITIDHVLVDRRIRVEAVHVAAVPGSDHRAVIVTLRLPTDLAVAE